MEPSFSIILPSLGRPDLLWSFLDGVARTATRKYQIVVGLDPRNHPTTLSHEGLPVEWVEAPSMGMSAATNAAFKASRGEWLILLADDMVPIQGWDDFGLDRPEPFIREDRILCFELLEPVVGSFPPFVEAGDSPETFDLKRAENAAFYRLLQASPRVQPGRWFGSAVLHRSKWIDWPEWTDPYSVNDISWVWETYLAHPDIQWGRLPGNCCYHFSRASVRANPDLLRDASQEFEQRYGISVDEAWKTIYRTSKERWEKGC